MSLERFSFFPFQWSCDQPKDSDNLIIRAYGWNIGNTSVCCVIEDFTIPIWIELPNNIDWTEGRITTLKDKLKKVCYGKNAPVSIDFKKLQRLYFADIVKHKENNTTSYKPLLFPFLQLNFKNTFAIKTFMKLVAGYKFMDRVDDEKLRISVFKSGSLGDIKLQFHCYESSISPILKLFALQNLPSSSWINIKGTKINDEEKQTTKKLEYRVSYHNMIALTQEECLKLPIVYPKIISYDLECYSSKYPAFPSATVWEDPVFQIGVTYMSQKADKKKYKKYLLTLFNCDNIKDVDKDMTGDDLVEVRCFKNERELYMGFKNLVLELDPDVIIGYNIFKFDITYMENRNNLWNQVNCTYKDMGCILGKTTAVTPIKWESKAYGKQEMKYLDIEGRLMIDLFPYVERSFKLKNYKLKTVCNEFLKTNKDDLEASDIFSLYKERTPKAIAKIGKYCIQDTWVTLLLYEKLLVWFDLVESATTNGVPMFYLYTKGQQIKMYSQMLKYCYHNNIVIQSKVLETKEGEEYSGAYVSDPVPGVYNMILPFDFASLYPSIIIAHNVDYTKLVVDESIPDCDCHVFDWIEHKNCKHDPEVIEKERKKKERMDKAVINLMKKNKNLTLKDAEDEIKSKQKIPKPKKIICGRFKYRFLKQDVSGKGVIPTLIDNLLKARKDTRKIIAKNEDKIKELGDSKEAYRLKEINMVLDKRQLAYKVSANSMYGAMGVKVGYLPFLPGAMCVTSKGRESIMKASSFLEEECQGKVIYNDTDSAYTNFPHLAGQPMEVVWNYALEVVEKVKTIFPAPMKLEFEEKAYTEFLILTKKRYAAFAMELDNPAKKLLKRGIVLTRRDNCNWLRMIYEKIMLDLLNNADEYSLLDKLENDKNNPHKGIFRSEKVRSLVNSIIDIVNSMFQLEYETKEFVITRGMKQLAHKGKTDPVHIHVAKKMIARGQPVEDGERIEYVLLDKEELKYKTTDKVLLKAEDANYYSQHKDILKLDYLTYLQRQCVNPVDELLKVGIKLDNLLEKQFELRLQKKKYVSTLRELFSPKFDMME